MRCYSCCNQKRTRICNNEGRRAGLARARKTSSMYRKGLPMLQVLAREKRQLLLASRGVGFGWSLLQHVFKRLLVHSCLSKALASLGAQG